MGDDDFHGQGPSRRWSDMPGTFEWRLLHQEKVEDDHDKRLRKLENDMSAIVEKVEHAVEEVTQTRQLVQQQNDQKYNQLWTIVGGFILVIATVIGSHLWFK